MHGDEKTNRRPLLVLTNEATAVEHNMPMRLQVAHAPLLSKILNLIDDDDNPKPARTTTICPGVRMDSEEAHLLTTNLVSAESIGLEHIALEEHEKEQPPSPEVNYDAQESEQARRTNILTYNLNMASELLDIASAVADKPDSPEHILAHLDTYINFEHTAEATYQSIKNTVMEAWQGRTSGHVAALKARILPKPIGEDVGPPQRPRDLRKEIDVEFAFLQQQFDSMKACIDIEREAIAHLPHHELTKECWALASQYLEEAKAHAAEWQQSVRLPPQREQSGKAGRAGGS